MKHLVRVFLFNVFGIWLTGQLLPTLTVTGDWRVFMVAGFVLSLLMIAVAPILRIMFIPINIITFGLLSWLINVIVMYLLSLLVSEVVIRPWTIPGISYMGFTVPPVHLSYFPALVGSTLLLTFITNTLHKVSEE